MSNIKVIQLKRATVTIELIKKVGQTGAIDRILQRLGEERNNIHRVPQEGENRKQAGRYVNFARSEARLFHPASGYRINIKLKHPKFNKFELSQDCIFTEGIDTWREIIPKYITAAIQTFRQRNKSNKPYTDLMFETEIKTSGPRKSGRVFIEPEQVLKAYIDKNIKSLYQEKKPEVINRYVGVELEFCAPISQAKLALLLFKAGIHKYAQLKEDRSLRPKSGETAFELAILLKEVTFKKDLKRVCDLLKTVGAVAQDRRCGLHVHLDMRRRNKDLVYNNLVACQDFLLKLVDPSRIDNEFCKIVNSRKMPVEFSGNRQERYKTINAVAYYKYKTLEVRMHEGSVDYNQIVNWVSILIKIANHRIKLKDNINSLTIFQKRFKLNKKLNNYATERSCYLQLNNREPQQAPTSTVSSPFTQALRNITYTPNNLTVSFMNSDEGDEANV